MAETQARYRKNRSRDKTTRVIPAEVWEKHKPTIKRLFYQRDPPLGLKVIRERMTVEHNFEASTKQWKNQLNRWELKRNMNLSDAAHILSLVRDAELRNINRRVSFFGSERTREDIKNYLKKTTRVKSEDELLQHAGNTNDRPSYITFEDLPNSPDEQSAFQNSRQTTVMPSVSCGAVRQQQQQQHQQHQQQHQQQHHHPHHSHHPHHQQHQQQIQNQNQLLQQTSPIDSFEYVVVNPPLPDPTAVAAPDVKIPTWNNNRNIQFTNFPDYHHPSISSSSSFGFHPPQVLDPAQQRTSDPFSNMSANAGFIDATGFSLGADNLAQFNSFMSVTPEMYFPNGHSAPVQSPALVADVKRMLGSEQDPEELSRDHPPTLTEQFLKHCCEACIYFGQGCTIDGEQSINYVNQIYKQILLDEFRESLTVLNNLRALFDSYGQRVLTDRIFACALSTAKSVLGMWIDHPITQTIQFMMSIPEQGSQNQPAYDIFVLKNIHRQFTDSVGKTSKLALTAEFHVAWALVEMKQFEEAREILVNLQIPCEVAFGPCHIQTIGCIATLARVYHSTGNGISAERLWRETVMPRVEERFSKSHPYLWEAKNRHALFLVKLAKSEPDLQKQQNIERRAEDTLREILLLRAHMLGSNNPRTNITFRALRRLLLRRQRTDEANALSQWCSSSNSNFVNSPIYSHNT